jgi:hypothetical protein
MALYCEDLRYSYAKMFRRNSKVWSVQDIILSRFQSQFFDGVMTPCVGTASYLCCIRNWPKGELVALSPYSRIQRGSHETHEGRTMTL